MLRISQTNLQLYNQMRKAGYSEEDQLYIAKAYGLCASLFTGQFRGTGKTFIAHLVGTASILISQQTSTAMISAALLHAAYLQGDFGYGLWKTKTSKRKEVEQVVGSKAEQLIWEYTLFKWNSDQMKSDLQQLDNLTERHRAIVLLRMANELEENYDFSSQYSSKANKLDGLHLPIIRLAKALGYHDLANDIDRVYLESKNNKVPACLVQRKRGSSTLLPRSCRKKLTTKIRPMIGYFLHKLRLMH